MQPFTEGKAEVVIYKDIAFRRYPASTRWADAQYYTPNATHRKRGLGRLHQEIWKDANGPIPQGYEIHHRDHDTLNNALDNLELISRADHHAHHDAGYTPEQLVVMRRRIEHARKSAINWHKSADGREWHRQNALASAKKRYLIDRTCKQCGSPFQSDNIAVASGKALYCSTACKTAARYASGVDNVERICVFCNKPFIINKYSPITHCSRTCSARHRALK